MRRVRIANESIFARVAIAGREGAIAVYACQLTRTNIATEVKCPVFLIFVETTTRSSIGPALMKIVPSARFKWRAVNVCFRRRMANMSRGGGYRRQAEGLCV